MRSSTQMMPNLPREPSTKSLEVMGVRLPAIWGEKTGYVQFFQIFHGIIDNWRLYQTFSGHYANVKVGNVGYRKIQSRTAYSPATQNKMLANFCPGLKNCSRWGLNLIHKINIAQNILSIAQRKFLPWQTHACRPARAQTWGWEFPRWCRVLGRAGWRNDISTEALTKWDLKDLENSSQILKRKGGLESACMVENEQKSNPKTCVKLLGRGIEEGHFLLQAFE